MFLMRIVFKNSKNESKTDQNDIFVGLASHTGTQVDSVVYLESENCVKTRNLETLVLFCNADYLCAENKNVNLSRSMKI